MGKKFARFLWNTAGTILVAIGIVGVFVPLLPTTEFLVLASVCYAHGSARFRNWLHNNRILGPYITNYREKKGITLRSKIITLAALWATLSYLIITSGIAAQIILAIILTGVSWHIVTRRTLK